MPFSVLTHEPESGITEKWVYESDVITSDNGEEQRISLSRLPKRSWSGNYTFDSEVDLRRHLATMFAQFKAAFDWPAWHMGVKIKTTAAAGQKTIVCNPARSDFRAGQKALIKLGSAYEVVTIDEIESDHVTVTTNLVSTWTKQAYICPIWSVYSANNAAVIRRPANKYATSSFSFFEYGFVNPFILEDDEYMLPAYATLPLLNRRAIGTEFNEQLITGAEVTDYGGQPSIRSRWNNAQRGFSLSWKCPRGYSPDEWKWWKTFADYCRGSVNPFFLPTFRPDFEIYTAAVGGGNTVVIADTSYSEVYQNQETFNNIVFTKPDGTQHFATITNVATGSGRNTLTFSPALPGGTWTGQILSFLLKCRIADDTVSTVHNGLNSLVTLNLRTVD